MPDDGGMTEATFTIDVQAPVDKIWSILIDKIRNPHNYVPNVTEVEILSDDETEVRRRMKVRGIELNEKILIDPDHQTVTFVLVDHPDFYGEIRNIISGPDDAPFLTFSGGWTCHDGSPGPDLQTAFQDAVLKTKVMAENA